MTIPERLVAIREANGYTRKRLAEELGKPYRTITNYENGEREPGHLYIVEIAKKFGVTTDYILGNTDIPYKKEEEKKDPSEDGIPEDVFNLLKSLSQEDLDIVLSFAKMMRQKEIEREQ